MGRLNGAGTTCTRSRSQVAPGQLVLDIDAVPAEPLADVDVDRADELTAAELADEVALAGTPVPCACLEGPLLLDSEGYARCGRRTEP